MPRPRWRVVLVLVLAILVVAIAAVVRLITLTPPRLGLRTTLATTMRVSGSAPRPAWPAGGQAALDVQGLGSLGTAGGTTPRPTASVAKVMTVYLTLKRYPLSRTGGGFTLTVTPADAQAEASDAKQGESVVAVRAGERLDERQLLEALLVRSGDNIAQMLAAYEAGSVPRFVGEMNRTARALGMHHTTYTDPSGLDPATVSDAADQLRVFERAMRFAVFRRIVSMPNVTLPVAGTQSNYDPLISEGYDGKTGSDSEAGGCFAFFKQMTVGGRRLTLVGVVLGQGQGASTSVLLGAAATAARRLVGAVAPSIRVRTLLPAETPAMVFTNADGHRAAATTAAPLRVIGWGGLREHLAMRAGLPEKNLGAGERVGEVTLVGKLPTPAGEPTQTAVRASAPLGAPGIRWRLAHLL